MPHRALPLLGLPLLLLLCLLPPGRARAAEAPLGRDGKEAGGRDLFDLPDVILSATRSEVRTFDLPFAARLLDAKELQGRRMVRTVPEIFASDPSVLVQKTSYGQGSPYLRGFTGFRTLFLIDGIRLNNATFREGPNQYWNTVDAFLVDRLEVVKGLASVLYGSDAVGGTVNVRPERNEVFGEGEGMQPRAHYRFRFPDLHHVVRAVVDGHVERELGLHAGVTYKDYGDLVAGGSLERLPYTGYTEWSGDLRAEMYLGDHARIVAAWQRTDQRDVPRTHKTVYGVPWHGTTAGNELARELDHVRDLGYVQLHVREPAGWLRSLRLSLSYHRQHERRDRTKAGGSGDVQGVTTGTPGAWGTAEFETPAGRVSVGAEYYRDAVSSFKHKVDAAGAPGAEAIQGPVADRAWYETLGVFLQDELVSESLGRVVAGLRWTHVRLVAGRVQDPSTGDRIRLADAWDDVSFSLRGSLLPAGGLLNVYAGAGTGFRAPNLSDLTRLDTARSNEIETPSPGLDPESFLSLDLGARLAWNDTLFCEATAYYTLITDMIVRYPTGRIVDGLEEVQKANVGDGWMAGVELSVRWKVDRHLELRAALAAAQGKVDTYPTSEQILSREWMDRVPPTSGRLSARWTSKDERFWAEAASAWAWRQRHLSPRDEGDTQRIPPGGTPGYLVVHLRGGWRISSRLSLAVALENLFDKEYRIHGSGQNEPGRGLVLGVTARY